MRKERSSAIEAAQRDLAPIVVREGKVRSFTMQGVRQELMPIFEASASTGPRKKLSYREQGIIARTSNYTHTLTWTPGHLTITGDIGEITLTHYQAMQTFDAALDWASTSDVHYLLGKSDKRQVLQVEDTLDKLKRTISEEIVEAVVGRTANWWRQGPDGQMFNDKRVVCGDLHELRAWRKGKDSYAFEGEAPEETEKAWLEDKPTTAFSPWQRWPDWKTRGSYSSEKHRRELPWHTFDIPDIWNRWVKLWQYSEWGDFYIQESARALGQPTCVLNGNHRREIWASVCDRVGDSDDELADLFYALDLEPSFSYDYDWRSYYLVSAVMLAVQKIKGFLSTGAKI